MFRTCFFTVALLLLSCLTANAQKTLWVGFYNQENLFDTIDDPHKNDNEFLPTGKNQWNTEKYQNKISNMAKVIAHMNNGKGADILGLCEVENSLVLNDLVTNKQLTKMKYNIVHLDGPDERSIDNALIYQSKKLDLMAAVPYPVKMANNARFKTRDILLVKLKEKKGKAEIIILVNHFPSRSGGEEESRPKRALAAGVLKSIYDSIVNANPAMPVVMMGDFNDEPTDSSIANVLGAQQSVTASSSHALFNAMYALKEQGIGSHFYRGQWHALDQLILSNNLVNCSGKICYQPFSVAVFKQDWMLEKEGKYAGTPLRTFGGQKYLNGYSDHLPVYLILTIGK